MAKRLPDNIRYQVTNPVTEIIDTDGKGTYNLSPIGFPSVDVSDDSVPTLFIPQFKNTYSNSNANIVIDETITVNIETKYGENYVPIEIFNPAIAIYSESNGVFDVSYVSHGLNNSDIVTIKDFIDEIDGIYSVIKIDDDNFQLEYSGEPSGDSYKIEFSKSILISSGTVLDLSNQKDGYDGLWYTGKDEWQYIQEVSIDQIVHTSTTNLDIVTGGLLSFPYTISDITSDSSSFEIIVTTNDIHGVKVNTDIVISGTTNFDATYKVKDILSTTSFSVEYDDVDYVSEATGVATFTSVVDDLIDVSNQTAESENGIYKVAVGSWTKIAKFYEYDGTENDNKFAIYYDGSSIADIAFTYNGKCAIGTTISNHGLVDGDVVEIISENGHYDGIFVIEKLSDFSFSYKLDTWDIPDSVAYANLPCLDKDGDVYDHFRNGYSHKEITKFINDKLSLSLGVAKVDGPLHRWLVDLVDVNFGGSGTQTVVVPAFPVSDESYTTSEITQPINSEIEFNRGSNFNDIYELRKSRKESIESKRVEAKREQSFAKWVLPGFNTDGNEVGEDKSANLRMYPEAYNKEYGTDDILGGGHVDGDLYDINEDDLRFYINASHSDLRPFSDSVIFYQKNNANHHNIILDASDENMFGSHSINLVNNLRDVDTTLNASIITLLEDMISTADSDNIFKKATVGNVTKYLYKKRGMNSITDFHLDTFTLDWSSLTTYETGEFAYYNGYVYESKVDGNINTTPDSDDSIWRETNIIRYSEIPSGVILDIEGEVSVTIEDSTLTTTSGNIIVMLKGNNDMVPSIITGLSDDELDTLFIDNSLQDQLTNASGQWDQARNYQKKAFIHLPTDGVKDGQSMDLKVTLPIKDPSLGNNFADTSIGVVSAYKNYVTQPRVYIMSGYQSLVNGNLVDTSLPEKGSDYTYSKMPEMEFISEDNVFHQHTMDSNDIVGNGDIGDTKDIRTLCAVIYPTTSETFSWRMDNNPRLKLMKEYLYNFSSYSGSASHVAYRRNQLTSYSIPSVSDMLDISSSEFALSYKYGADAVYGYSTYLLNKNTLAVNTRTYMVENLIPTDDDLISSDVRSTYGSFTYQADSAFRKLVSDFYSMRVAYDEVKSDNNVQKYLGFNNTTSSEPTGFFDNVIQTNNIELPTQASEINEDRWFTKPLYAPEYIIDANIDTDYPENDPFSSISGVFKTYMENYYGSNEESSNSGDRYVYGSLIPTIDTEFAFGRSGDNVIINHLVDKGADADVIKDLKRTFWETSLNKTVDNSLYFLDQSKHRKYDYFNFGGGNSFPEYNSAYYGFYWNSFSNIISLDGIKPGSHDVDSMLALASGETDIETTLYNSLQSNPVVANYLDNGDKFVSVNTPSSNFHLEEFLRNYLPGYSNSLPIRFYNSYRVLLQGDATSTSHASEEVNRIFKYSVTDYLSEFVDSGDTQQAIDDLIAVEEINQSAVDAEDVNVSWGYFDDGNDSSLSDLITVSGNQYLFNSDYYNDLSSYTYIRVSVELVYSKCSGRWLTMGYRQTPISYLTPTIGNAALSHVEESNILPDKNGDSVDDYVLLYQPDIDNTYDVASVNVSGDSTSVVINEDITTGVNTYAIGDSVYFYTPKNVLLDNGAPNLDTMVKYTITDLTIDGITYLEVDGALVFSTNDYNNGYVKFTKEINTIDNGTYPRDINTGNTVTDYLWKDKNCMDGEVYNYLYETPYHKMQPMDLNPGTVPFLSTQFPYNSDGTIKSFYNTDGEYEYETINDYRTLVLDKLHSNSNINYVVPNNNSGGQENPISLVDFMPHLWRTYWHRRPVISSYQGADVPSRYTRSGGDISDPVLGSMFTYLDLRKWENEEIEYFIPYHKDMSQNWLENGMTIKDANFIDDADDRTEYYEFDANIDGDPNRVGYREYDANRHGAPSYPNGVIEVISDVTNQSVIRDTTIANGLTNYEDRTYGNRQVLYSATSESDYSSRTLLNIRIPEDAIGKEIVNATLTFNVTEWEDRDYNSTVFFNVHRMLVPWNEGTGFDSTIFYDGQVNSAEINGATKSNSDFSTLWNVPFIGLDDSDATVSVYSTGSNAYGESTTEFDLTDLVRLWTTNPETNLGLVIVNPDALDDQTNNPTNLPSFPVWASSEYNESNLRPNLVITYKL